MRDARCASKALPQDLRRHAARRACHQPRCAGRASPFQPPRVAQIGSPRRGDAGLPTATKRLQQVLRAKAGASDAPATCSTGRRALRHFVSHLRPNPPGTGIGTKSMTQFEMRCLRTNTDRSSVRTLNVPTFLGYCAQVPKTSALLAPLSTVGQHEWPTGALVDGAVVHDGSKLSSPASVSLR